MSLGNPVFFFFFLGLNASIFNFSRLTLLLINQGAPYPLPKIKNWNRYKRDKIKQIHGDIKEDTKLKTLFLYGYQILPICKESE